MTLTLRLRQDYASEHDLHPGEYPYTRGISTEPGPWIMGQYSGFGTAAETNLRFRELLDAGQTGFSVALDLPTQLGIDSDDPRAIGEVGRVGVAIDSLADVETLFDSIPLDRISQVRTTANSIGYIWAALLTAHAEKQGIDPNRFGMFIQNDVLKEFMARGTQIFPPGPSLKLTGDVVEHVAREVPHWVPLAVSGYHIREAGSTAVQEIAFTFANAIAYLDDAVARGLSVDDVAPTLFTFLSANIDFLREVSKFRAARRVWARMLTERYGAEDSRSAQLRIFVFTAGSSLVAQQPMNNVVRATVEAVIAALGGVQTMHVCAYDEAVGVPTAEAATLALRTQQVVAFETGLTETVDPLGGSYAVEQLTDDLEEEIVDLMERVEERGGSLRCIEDGWYQRQITDSAWQATREIESGERVVVGVNRFETDPVSPEVFQVDPDVEHRQAQSVAQVRQERDQHEADEALDGLARAAANGDNVVRSCINAAKAYVTIGEMVSCLKQEYGEWTPDGVF